jgi:Flp pilus assembly protein TadD
MTRPNRNRLLVVALCLVCLAAGNLVGVPLAGVLFVAALTSYIASRELFAARRALRQKRWVDALMGLQRFEAQLTSPARRALSWLAVSLYTFDARAIARNLTGVVHLENGNLDLAQAAFQSALQLDALYAVPYLNLAVIAARRKDTAAMESHLAQAARLGLTNKKAHAKVRAAA